MGHVRREQHLLLALKTALIACLMLLPYMLVSSAQADIFMKRQSDGTLSFSDCPIGGNWNIYYQEKRRGKAPVMRKDRIERIITDIAHNHGMDPEIIKGIVQVESGYNTRALSSKGAIGLMQLMPQTASAMGVGNPWDPVENITGGTKYFSHLLYRYHGDLTKALAAYNAGPTVVDIYEGIPPYQETKEYVKSVLAIINGGRK